MSSSPAATQTEVTAAAASTTSTTSSSSSSSSSSDAGTLVRSLSELALSSPSSPVRPEAEQVAESDSESVVSTSLETRLAATSLPLTSSRTLLLYDVRCLAHEANYAHVESPLRASTTHALLQQRGLVQRCAFFDTARAMTTPELILAHDKQHVDKIDATEFHPYKPDEPDSETEGDDRLYPDCVFFDGDTFANRYSANVARLACGGLYDICEKILLGQGKNAFAVIRPPGHHADTVAARGFCLYNNVAVAAKALLHRHADTLKRVVIIDWDVHHGDGTQNIFYEDERVLYISIHRYQNGSFYPHTGAAEEVGKGAAVGKNINIPLNFKGFGDLEYLCIMDHIIVPILKEFKADLTIISAGFDCALGDPLGGMEVTPEGFAHLTKKIMDATENNRVVCALEGGYNVRAVSESICSCVSSLLGDALPILPFEAAAQSDESENAVIVTSKREQAKLLQKRALFIQDLQSVIKIQKVYWNSLQQSQLPHNAEELMEKYLPKQSKKDGVESSSSSSSSGNSTSSKVPVRFRNMAKVKNDNPSS